MKHQAKPAAGEMLERIRVVLVQTSHPGNIGAAARAMKNMGLRRLTLVQPKVFPSLDAYRRSAGASDILDDCRVVATLDEAVADCVWVVGTSARHRTIDWPLYEPEACARHCLHHTAGGEVAIVFGRENSGLTNAELERCHALVHIPVNPDYASLNVAAAVQVLCYECRKQALPMLPVATPVRGNKHRDDVPVDRRQLDAFYAHLQAALDQSGFFGSNEPDKLMRRLKALFNRASLSKREVAILHGICSILEGRKS